MDTGQDYRLEPGDTVTASMAELSLGWLEIGSTYTVLFVTGKGMVQVRHHKSGVVVPHVWHPRRFAKKEHHYLA